jgi:hypothetical protein
MLREWKYCDNCGEVLQFADEIFIIPSLSVDIDSINAGEPATLCENCFLEIRNAPYMERRNK